MRIEACDRFAGAFLAPRVAVLQLLGAQRHALEWQELYVLKHEFGLSMAGWLHRAKQCGMITETAHLAMVKRFAAKGWRKNEPGETLPQEHPRLFDQLVYRALAEQYLSEGKAAELLGIPMMRKVTVDEWMRYRRWLFLKARDPNDADASVPIGNLACRQQVGAAQVACLRPHECKEDR